MGAKRSTGGRKAVTVTYVIPLKGNEHKMSDFEWLGYVDKITIGNVYYIKNIKQ